MVPDISTLRGHYEDEAFKSLKSSLKILGDLQFFELLVSLNKQILLDSFESESPEVLAGKIIEARQTNRVFLALRDLAHPTQEGHE